VAGAGPRDRLGGYLPILSWGPAYPRGWFGRDAIAGLTLWGLLVPEGMAYAGIADLPPQAGLYTLVVSLVIYALMGTSRHLSVGPTSATAALLASSVTTAVIATSGDAQDPGTYVASAAAFVLVTGLVFLVAGMLRLGFVTQFLSKPVMDGFVVGLAVFVAVGQLNKLFGVEKPEGNTVQKFVGIIKELPEANWVAFAIGAASLVVLFGLPRINPKLPAGLVVLFGTILVSKWLDLEGVHEVEVVGTLPQGLPSLTFTAVPLDTYLAMVLPAIGVFLVAYSESLGVAHEFADKHGYEIDANQELNAHAATNILSALFGGMLASGGMSGSAVKEGAGAQSQVANLVAWVATVITLLFFTPLFASLPEAVLGALIIHAVWHIIASRKLRTLRHESRTEFWFGLLAMLGVLLIDVLEGMIIGLVASLVFVVYQSSRPHLACVGRIPGAPGAYSDLERHPDNTPVPGVLILRLHAALYYANAVTVRDQVRAHVEAADPQPRALVVDLGAQDTLDLTSAKVLIALGQEMRHRGIAAYLADVHTPALAFARSVGVLDVIDEEHVFPTIELAVQHIERAHANGAQANGAQANGAQANEGSQP
jgi:high affinity sulfate transporter 1